MYFNILLPPENKDRFHLCTNRAVVAK